MSAPFLSVVIPAYNEERRLAGTLEQLVNHLASKRYAWEIVVADDGSSDTTGEIVARFAQQDPRVRLLSLEHRGKGWAVKNGMLESRGDWRFMCDADLSMPAEQIDRFLPGDAAPEFDIGVGSREAQGSRRIDEPFWRHVIGRVYNRVASMLAVGGLRDTQCGFKLYRGELVRRVFGRQTLDGFGFDIEVLYLARKEGASFREIAIDWYFRTESKVGAFSGARGFLDILAVRWNDLRGRYRRTDETEEAR